MGLWITALYSARRLWPVLSFRGLKVPVTGAHVSRPVWKHVWRGDYEAPELDALRALLRPTDRVLELGTGMGLVSGVVAKEFPAIHVYAFEANPSLIPVIEALHKRNEIANVTLRNEVLLPNPREASIRFNLHRNFTESSLSDRIESQSAVDVPVRDINAVVAEVRPDVFVCDIEGAEAQVFDGLDLAGLRVVVIELHPHLLKRAEIKLIYDTCAKAGLYPRVEHSDLTVVAFERVEE